MALTEKQIERAKAKKSRYRLVDNNGLTLVVSPTGSKHWVFRYTFAGKRREMTFGAWPTVSLIKARELRQDADDLIFEQIDPLEHKRGRLEREQTNGETLRDVAREFFDRQLYGTRPPAQQTQYKNERFLFIECASLLDKDIKTITPKDVLDVIKGIEANGNIHTAHRVRSKLSEVFRYAIANLRAENDPTYALRGAITPEVRKNRAAITERDSFGRLLHTIDGYTNGHPPVQIGLKILAYMYMRPGELRKSEWSWIKWDEREWRLPAEIMKMRKEHSSPIPDQVYDLLKQLREMNLHERYMFPTKLPSRATGEIVPMSDNAMTTALRNMGIGKDEHCPHGFRATANTLLIKAGFNEAWIETSLAHQYGTEVSRAYNRYRYWDERASMAQQWADMVDEIRGEHKLKVDT